MPGFDELNTEIQEMPEYKDLGQNEWEAKIETRGVDVKFDADLEWLKAKYAEKISRIREALRGDWSCFITPYKPSGTLKTPQELGDELMAQISTHLQKEERLLDKLACVIKERELRKEGLVVRTPHHTTYYADYINGDDSKDGLTTGNAWKTIHKYTTVTVRTPGDILKLRANTTWNYGEAGEEDDITFDEDGTVDDYITIKGCDSSDDPWGDSSDVDARIDFDEAEQWVFILGDDFWMFDNIEVRGAFDANIYLANSKGIYLKDCVLKSGLDNGLQVVDGSVFLENCTIKDNGSSNIFIDRSSRVHLDSCAVDGGSGPTTFGVQMSGGTLLAEDTTFGFPNVHNMADIFANGGAPVTFLRNCDLNTPPRLMFGSGLAYCAIHEEDKDWTFEGQLSTYVSGTVERSTAAVRSGGADSSALMKPGSECGPNYPLTLRGQFDTAGDFKIWCPAVETTITIYMRRYGDWTAEPTSSELYIQASYLNNGASASRALSTKSSQNLPDSDAWTAFTTTFTPAREGWAYVTVTLRKYESGKGVYVDIKPVVS